MRVLASPKGHPKLTTDVAVDAAANCGSNGAFSCWCGFVCHFDLRSGLSVAQWSGVWEVSDHTVNITAEVHKYKVALEVTPKVANLRIAC